MLKLLDNRRYLYLYPCILLQGIAVNLVVKSSQLEHQKDTVYILSSGNWINQIFAYRGNLIWTVVYIALACFQIHLQLSREGFLPLDPRSESERNKKTLFKAVKPYVAKLVLKNLALLVVFLVIDRVFVWTGGSCSTSSTKSAEKCRKQGGRWENGFDVSGHFCFLTTVSLILWQELRLAFQYMAANEINGRSSRTWLALQSTTLAVLIVWAFILCVTAIYYHTLLEKVLGLAMGYICPAVIYWVIPNNQKLSSLLY
ncbi:LAME_0E12640g1_1 [Lachancea meyersii CBS 8951]|uniref:Acyl-coenzyme A diphosphatase YFT2 n=1 Tax=Lachancea meyersii CBS 8951 TaxID=1266667 RepID=A0A1G4JLI7_9SACH|nr:LAME_0E12640g1_1 [Lachancea meyersii CBS 8951]